MKKTNDFDKWLLNATYSEVDQQLSYSPYPRRFPTLLSTCGQVLYISSLDEFLDVNNSEELEFHIEELVYRLKSASRRQVQSNEYMTLGIIRSDFNALAVHIGNLQSTHPNIELKYDVDYRIPDEAFHHIFTTIELKE